MLVAVATGADDKSGQASGGYALPIDDVKTTGGHPVSVAYERHRMAGDDSDEELMREVARGRADRLEMLVRRYGVRLMTFLSRMIGP